MYDLIVIGGGPAGYVAAERAGHNKLKVLLIEERELGGVCLNEGCIPTKTLLHSSKVYTYAKEGEAYGIHTKDVTFDFSAIMKRKSIVVKTLIAGVAAKMKMHKVEVKKAKAEILKPDKDSAIRVQADGKVHTAKYLMICSGAEAAVPPIPGLEIKNIMTSREILDIDRVPGSLTIIGGGVIGLEFAAFFSTMGSKCTVIEMLPEILPGVDKEICQTLRKNLSDKGVEFNLGCKVTKLKGKEVIFEKDGKSQSVKSDEVLLSIGRKPITSGFGLENIGVELDRGGIKIDENCRTNIPNVYAAGDVTGFSLLAHTAYREAEVAVNHICGRKDRMRYTAIPGVVYTSPEVATIGLTEEQAREDGIDIQTAKLPLVYSGRFVAENKTKDGLCKIIATRDKGIILGVHMIGSHCSEMIFGAAMMIETEMRFDDIKEIVFPHPTVSEIFKETAFSV